MRKAGGQLVVQAKLSVSKPADPLEKEADRTADQVMRMAGPAAALRPPAGASRPNGPPSAEQQVQRFGEGTPNVTADAQVRDPAGDHRRQALSPDVREFMEPRLGADFGDVRVHTDESAPA